MILSRGQLVGIVRFADSDEDVFVRYSFAADENNNPETINVGRLSDYSMVRITYDGTTYVLNNGTREHAADREETCWCGVKHGTVAPVVEEVSHG
jgi:hypothetical protein